MVSTQDWIDLKNVRGMLDYHRDNNLHGRYNSVIPKEVKIVKRLMQEALVADNP